MLSVYPPGQKLGVVNSPTKENPVVLMTGSSSNGYWQNTLKFCPDWTIAGRRKSFLDLKYRKIYFFLQFQLSLLVSPKTKSGILMAAVHNGFGPVGGTDLGWESQLYKSSQCRRLSVFGDVLCLTLKQVISRHFKWEPLIICKKVLVLDQDKPASV